MDDFRFRGRHVSEFGAVAAFGDSMRFGGKARRGEYGLPGGGSVLIGEDEWQPTQRSVALTPADGVDADGPWRRALCAWLQGGRGEMIVDNDPDVMMIASFDQDGTYEHRSWPAGCLVLNMTLQPLAYDVLETQHTVHLAAGSETAASLDVGGAMAVPLRIQVRPTGEAITRIRATAGGAVLDLPNLNLKKGQILEYNAGILLGEAASLTVDGAVDFSPAQGGSWARLKLDPTGGAIRILIEGGAADVVISARGRYPA